MALDERPTAAFCYNDMTALGLLHAAWRASLCIPGELAVVGFDDIGMAAYTQPPLTSIAQPTGEMGRRAVEMVLALVETASRGEADAPNVVVQGKLIVRESTGATYAGQVLANLECE
jgi:DNA-binding LacI/PurR family transcriptional regulator